jgi:hypothetical protein
MFWVPANGRRGSSLCYERTPATKKAGKLRVNLRFENKTQPSAGGVDEMDGMGRNGR